IPSIVSNSIARKSGRIDLAYIPFRGSPYCFSGILQNFHILESSIDPIITITFEAINDSVDLLSTQRNIVWITIHKAHVLTICHYLDNVSAEKRAPAFCSARPVEDRATLKMPAQPQQR